MPKVAKTESVEVETKEIKKDEFIDLQKELEKSKKENEDMMVMIKALKEQMDILKSMQSQTVSPVIIKQNDNTTRTVEVTSLLNNMFNLTTEARGRGKAFIFRNFGEKKTIKFSDMQAILENYKKDFEIGRAVLGSKKDYEDLQIGYIYDDVLTAKDFKNIILLKDDNAINDILNMNKEMQDNIASLIAERMVNSEENTYDYNKIKKLEDAGLNIIELSKIIEMDNNKEEDK